MYRVIGSCEHPWIHHHLKQIIYVYIYIYLHLFVSTSLRALSPVRKSSAKDRSLAANTARRQTCSTPPDLLPCPRGGGPVARVLGSAPMGLHPVSTTGLATPTQKAIRVPSPAPLPSQCAGTISGLDGPRPSGDGGDCPPVGPGAPSLHQEGSKTPDRPKPVPLGQEEEEEEEK